VFCVTDVYRVSCDGGLVEPADAAGDDEEELHAVTPRVAASRNDTAGTYVRKILIAASDPETSGSVLGLRDPGIPLDFAIRVFAGSRIRAIRDSGKRRSGEKR
jgi:hypothetical protein